MNRTRALLSLFALVLAAPAGAGEEMLPGQYEYTMKMEMPGMPFAMPPQTFRNCITQADLDQGRQYDDQQNKDCEVRNLKQSANKATFDVACKDGTTGKAEYAFTSTSMTGKTTMNRQGQAMTMNLSARRAGDCPK